MLYVSFYNDIHHDTFIKNNTKKTKNNEKTVCDPGHGAKCDI